MLKFKLKNRLKVIVVPRKTDSVVIQVNVHCGSNFENTKINGISHFIEHIIFEGTKKRTSRQIANEIEGIGGEISAYTSHEKTCFYVKVLKKHLEKAVDILADIIQNPIFDKKAIEKERKILISEIAMINDEPRFYQWILFQKALYRKHPTKNPIYGTIKAVKSISRQDLINYHDKYYVPSNIIISVVGDVKNVVKLIEKYFVFEYRRLVKVKFLSEKEQFKVKKLEKRQINQSYVVLGYKAVPRKEKESYVFDVIRGILGRGLSGKLFEEIRTKRALAYDVGINHEANIDYGYFSAYFSTNKKNIDKCIKIILDEFKKLKNITEEELKEAKDFIEGEFVLDNEGNREMADTVAFWELVSDAKDALDYIKKIKKVSKKEVVWVVSRYLTDKYVLAVIEQN